jgi:excisionase family DNA binding protein
MAEHAQWLRQYARSVRRAAKARRGDAQMVEVAARLLAIASVLDGQDAAGERGRFADYARVDEVAARLKIHPESARRLMRQGRLPGVRVGMLWLMERGDLEVAALEYERHPRWGVDPESFDAGS